MRPWLLSSIGRPPCREDTQVQWTGSRAFIHGRADQYQDATGMTRGVREEGHRACRMEFPRKQEMNASQLLLELTLPVLSDIFLVQGSMSADNHQTAFQQRTHKKARLLGFGRPPQESRLLSQKMPAPSQATTRREPTCAPKQQLQLCCRGELPVLTLPPRKRFQISLLA